MRTREAEGVRQDALDYLSTLPYRVDLDIDGKHLVMVHGSPFPPYNDYVTKGSNILTEHYSAVQADVPDASDVSTQINTRLIQTLESADQILIAGEARTHCLANTVRDIANNFGDDSFVSKLVLLTDASSDIPGFETHAQAFMKEMTTRGMQLTTTTEFLA